MTLLEPLTNRPIITEVEPMSAVTAESSIGGRLHAPENVFCATTSSEQPWHGHLINYLAAGMTQVEAARACDCSTTYVTQLLRTPWFAEKVTKKIEEGSVDILKLFRSASFGAYTTLVEICNDDKAPKNVRVASAKEILDRTLGKSPQLIETKSSSPSSDPVEEAERLLSSVRTELDRPIL